MNFLHDTHAWLLISFLIFMGILWRFGKSAVLAMLDKHIEDIRKELETAETLRIESQELLAQYQRKHRDAMKDAEKIIESAQKNAKDSHKQAETDLEETIARREAQLKGRIERMEQSAIQEIQSYAADLAMNAATEIIVGKLDKKTGEKLIDQSIKDVKKQVH